MDTLLDVLPSSKECRATANISGRRTVITCRDGTGEFVPPSNLNELDENEQSAIMARGGSRYVTYLIEVAQVTPFRKSWTIERRYREFVVFAAALEKQLSKARGVSKRGGILTIQLPPKQVFMIDNTFLKKREIGLNLWIQQIPKLLQEEVVNEGGGGGGGEDSNAMVHELIRSFLLPPAVRLLRHKRIQSDQASISSMTSDPTPPPSPLLQSSDSSMLHGSSMLNSGSSSANVDADEEDLGNVDEAVFSNSGNGNDNGSTRVHPQQALSLVACGSYVFESEQGSSSMTNTFSVPVESMGNVITIVYRDGCYTYFRASLLLRRIVGDTQEKEKQEKEKQKNNAAVNIEKEMEEKIKKFLKIPDDENYSDTGTARFPVRYQNEKVGHVTVHAKLKERETIRKSIQMSFKKIRTYGPFGVIVGCVAMYLSTWLLMMFATIVGFLGYGLFRPLHRDLELTIVPSNSWANRLDEMKSDGI